MVRSSFTSPYHLPYPTLIYIPQEMHFLLRVPTFPISSSLCYIATQINSVPLAKVFQFSASSQILYFPDYSWILHHKKAEKKIAAYHSPLCEYSAFFFFFFFVIKATPLKRYRLCEGSEGMTGQFNSVITNLYEMFILPGTYWKA